MFINFKKPVKELNGSASIQNEKELIVGTFILDAISASNIANNGGPLDIVKNMETMDKYRLGKAAQLIFSSIDEDKEVEIDDGILEIIKDICGKIFSHPVLLVQIIDLLVGNTSEKISAEGSDIASAAVDGIVSDVVLD